MVRGLRNTAEVQGAVCASRLRHLSSIWAKEMLCVLGEIAEDPISLTFTLSTPLNPNCAG
jgi:hypothetical protein